MSAKEKAAYIKGLISGLDLDKDKDETKVFNAILDWIENISSTVSTIQDEIEDIRDELEDINDDLSELEHECDDFDDDDYDEDFCEYTCPECKKVICLPKDSICDRSMECPSCGTHVKVEDTDCSDCKCSCEPSCRCDDIHSCGCNCDGDK